MKYWVTRFAAAAAAVGIVLTAVGCGGTSSTTPVTDGFTCHTTIQYREMAVEGDLTCSEAGQMTLAFTLPKSLQGVTLGWDGTAMSMELGGMRMDLPTDKVPQGALIRCLLQVLTAAHPDGTVTDEGYVISGETEGVAYALVCDPTSGLPRTLSVPQEELEATFADVTYLTE